MGWISDFVKDPIGTTLDTGKKAGDVVVTGANSVVNAVTNHPIEAAALAAGGYYGATALTGSEALATGVSSGSVVETALPALGTDTASTAGLSGIDLGGVGGSPATWTNATSAGIADYATNGLTATQVAQLATSGLNLATSAAKLGAVSKMNSPTTSGLTSALASGPSTLVSTPNGPEAVASQGIGATTAQPSKSGMDTQTMIVIAVAVAGIWYLMKKE